MTLSEIMESDFSVRKTVWSKRGDKVTRRVVDKEAPFNIEPRTHIEVEDDDDAD